MIGFIARTVTPLLWCGTIGFFSLRGSATLKQIQATSEINVVNVIV